MKLAQYFIALLFVLVLSACSASEDTVAQPSVEPAVALRTTTQPEVVQTAETSVVAVTPLTVDDIPVNETCNYWTYIPCRAYPPSCKNGYVLQQGLCTLSVCNYETYIPCAVPPSICEEDKVLVQGICAEVFQAYPQGSTIPVVLTPSVRTPNRNTK